MKRLSTVWQAPITKALNDYGSLFATGLAPIPSENYLDPRVNIVDATGEGVPPQTALVMGRESITALRDLCNEVLELDKERKEVGDETQT